MKKPKRRPQRPVTMEEVDRFLGSPVARRYHVSIGQEAGQNIGQDGERERLPDEGDLQAPRMCHDWS